MILFCFLGYMSDKFFMRLAKSIGSEYLELGIFLGLTQPAIKAIHSDSDNVVSCIFQILTTWRDERLNPDSMSVFKELCDAFTDLGKAKIVDRITRGK